MVCRNNVCMEVLDMVKHKQNGMKPVHYHDEWKTHSWRKDDDGSIDDWAYESSDSIHHGPVCKRCGYSFCVLCDEDGYDDGPCVIDRDVCPICGDAVFKTYKFCPECGQKLNWSVE